jgi:hypothetical protein
MRRTSIHFWLRLVGGFSRGQVSSFLRSGNEHDVEALEACSIPAAPILVIECNPVRSDAYAGTSRKALYDMLTGLVSVLPINI